MVLSCDLMPDVLVIMTAAGLAFKVAMAGVSGYQSFLDREDGGNKAMNQMHIAFALLMLGIRTPHPRVHSHAGPCFAHVYTRTQGCVSPTSKISCI